MGKEKYILKTKYILFTQSKGEQKANTIFFWHLNELILILISYCDLYTESFISYCDLYTESLINYCDLYTESFISYCDLYTESFISYCELYTEFH